MCGDPARLSATARGAVETVDNEVFFSAVSAVEISIKYELGQLSLSDSPERWVPAARARLRLLPLALDETAAVRMASLPRLHRDPFDRMLVCQAMAAGLTLVTPDSMIQQYTVATLW